MTFVGIYDIICLPTNVSINKGDEKNENRKAARQRIIRYARFVEYKRTNENLRNTGAFKRRQKLDDVNAANYSFKASEARLCRGYNGKTAQLLFAENRRGRLPRAGNEKLLEEILRQFMLASFRRACGHAQTETGGY